MFLGHASPWLSLLSWGGRGMKKDYKQHPTAFQTVVMGKFYSATFTVSLLRVWQVSSEQISEASDFKD